MNKYIVDYDLNGSEKDYENLIKAIKKFEYKKICKSSWIIKTDLSVSEIRDSFKNCYDEDDIIFIAKISGWASHNLPQGVGCWFKDKN